MKQNKKQQTFSGTLQKVVRVPSVHDDNGLCSSDLEGYGIVRSSEGADVFFVDSAVSHGGFFELESGMDVGYVLEDGPLARAAEVWPQTGDNQSHTPSSAEGDSLS